MPPVALTELGRYQLVELLGRGGMAEVYKARLAGALGINRLVAVKRMLPEARAHAEYVDLFIREARVCSRMMHPNLIQIFELAETNAELFLAMELVEGPDLRKVLNANQQLGKAVPMEFAICIANGILRGLDAAHRLTDDAGQALGVVHRDLSPANVLLSYEGAIKVADFGVAHSGENPTSAGDSDKIKGKLQYMAPEQIVGLPLDLRVDVFAAAAVIYEMVTGQPLYAWTDAADVVQRVAHARFTPMAEVAPGVDAQLAAVIAKGLAAEPGQRYASCDAFATDLARLVQQGRVPCATESELALYLQVLTPKQPFRAELVYTPLPPVAAQARRPSTPALAVPAPAVPKAVLRQVGSSGTGARAAVAPPTGSFAPGSRPPSRPSETPPPLIVPAPASPRPSSGGNAPSSPPAATARPPSKPKLTPPAPSANSSSTAIRAQVATPKPAGSSPRLAAVVATPAPPPKPAPPRRPLSGGDLRRPPTPAPKRPDSGAAALDALLVSYLAGDSSPSPKPAEPAPPPKAPKGKS